MTVTITSGGTTSTGTFTFGSATMESLRCTRSSEIEHTPFPLGTADQAFAVDVNGVTERLTINGRFVAETSTRVAAQTITTIAQQITWFKNLQDGNQNTHRYSDDYESNRPFFVESFEYNRKDGEPLSVDFTLTIIIGGGT